LLNLLVAEKICEKALVVQRTARLSEPSGWYGEKVDESRARPLLSSDAEGEQSALRQYAGAIFWAKRVCCFARMGHVCIAG
jgi:hypothetical protein